jgi:hypothetical protein
VNKIKVYGKQFAEILPYLIFWLLNTF